MRRLNDNFIVKITNAVVHCKEYVKTFEVKDFNLNFQKKTIGKTF